MATVREVDQLTALYALVDWDNLERSFEGRNKADDVAFQLRERLVELSAARFPGVTEIDVRCYSGWLGANGVPTPAALVVRPKIHSLSRRIGSLTVRMDCPDGMIVQGAPPIFAHLAGPRDCRCDARGQIFEQKMVDTMIVADAAALAEFRDIAIVVVGDDIDLAPGLVMAGTQRAFVTGRESAAADIVWLRRRRQTRQTQLLADVAAIEDW